MNSILQGDLDDGISRLHFVLESEARGRYGGGMEAIAGKPKKTFHAKGRLPKWNWEPILREVDSGADLSAVATKYSIPFGTLRQKVHNHRSKMAAVARAVKNIAFQETGEPAVHQSLMAIEAPKSHENQLVIAELSDTEVVTLLSNPETLASLPAMDAEKLMARRLQALAGQALVNLPPAVSVKDALALVKAFRDTSGLAGKEGKGGAGLLAAPRSMTRRQVTTVEAELLLPAPADSVPEGFEWPEGM